MPAQGDGFVEAFAAAGPSAALTVLDLSENAVACRGAAALAGALAAAGAECRLQQLDLGFNSVGDAGAAALAGVVSAAPALAALELEGNEVSTAVSLNELNPCG